MPLFFCFFDAYKQNFFPTIPKKGVFMCTAVLYKNLFGRNFDFEHGFGEEIVFLPRNFPLRFEKMPEMNRHNAIIGTAYVAEGTPLFYDCMNEHGLCAAALNFPGNAVYMPEREGFHNLASYEIMTWILASCSNISEAKEKLKYVNVLSTDFSKGLKSTPLHWIFADKTGSLVAEPLMEGFFVTENPVGILTNSPVFNYHLENLRNYANLSPEGTARSFGRSNGLLPQWKGGGSFGLPGDLSSPSRFIRAAFSKSFSASETPEEDLSQFFHILSSVEQIKGTVRTEDGFERTIYSSAMDMDFGIYYYRTYENSAVTAVDMKKENYESEDLRCRPFIKEPQIFHQN